MSYRVREDNKLEARLPGYVPASYDMGNLRLNACVDGLALNRLSLCGAYDVVLPGGYYGVCGRRAPDDPAAERTVVAYGRVQETRFSQCDVAYRTRWVLDAASPVLYLNFSAESCHPFTLEYNFGVQCPPAWLNLLCSASLILREREENYRHYTARVEASPDRSAFSAALTVAFDLGLSLTQAALEQSFFDAEADAESYFATLLSQAEPTEDTAFSAFARNAAYSSYKSFAGFDGFFAGVNYAAPARTYYRDGYYTALAVLRQRPDWVRSELVTLARGIGDDGACGSAVDANGAPWWTDHADSPLFFALLLYAYVSQTGDAAILQEDGMMQKLTAILDATAAALDENGLLLRAPASRHDWADNVFREGYVTYIECLAYGALRLGGSLTTRAAHYTAAAERVKEGVNRLLWSEELGYYVNFCAPEETETNLSIDTVFAALFELAPPERAKRMLAQMEALLETRNNARFGEFGTLCVYPPYAASVRLVEKSAYPLRYHNGADWPYLSALYAFAKKLYGMDYRYPLTRWFTVGLEQGFATPVEYYSPYYPAGGMLQGWSAFAAVVLERENADGIFR
ncbi:MAG: amylo-alpha-1,6-glucosidase [Christensenella sp.]|nr:amylo-alpha-1,6-glucosidase [Christensenella sp.]